MGAASLPKGGIPSCRLRHWSMLLAPQESGKGVNKTEARPPRVGELLAEKYRVTRYLGQGGMGAVYEAQHAVVGRRFAVKYLHADLANQREPLERFRREARAAGALENENIV